MLFCSQGRLKPGRMLLVDTQEKSFMKDEVIKSNLANLRPVGSWLQEVGGTSCFLNEQLQEWEMYLESL